MTSNSQLDGQVGGGGDRLNMSKPSCPMPASISASANSLSLSHIHYLLLIYLLLKFIPSPYPRL